MVGSSSEVTGEGIDRFADNFERLSANIQRLIRGQDQVVRTALVCLFAQGHILLEGVPGVGKTTLAKAIRYSIAGGSWGRIQFTPDLLPADVTGSNVFNQRDHVFEFAAGPVFNNVVLADEINRASPKTQSALLEVMEERQVSSGNNVLSVVPAGQPFVVIATQNPIEHEGTYRLPEAQLDRFMMKIDIGYPSRAEERTVLLYRSLGASAERLEPVLDMGEVAAMMRVAESVRISEPLADYVVDLVTATRPAGRISSAAGRSSVDMGGAGERNGSGGSVALADRVRLGVSPRGGLALITAARAFAASQGRGYVTADDVKALAHPVLGHRILLRAARSIAGDSAHDILDAVLAEVPVPRDRAR